MKVVKLSDSVESSHLLDLSVKQFLDVLGEPSPAPAAGSTLALAVAFAAGLCMKTAQLSKRQINDATSIADLLLQLRDRSALLCQLDADAYVQLIQERRKQRLRQVADDSDATANNTLDVASDVPYEIATIAVQVGEIAANLAENGNPNLIGDSFSAALLSESAMRSALALVAINLNITDNGEHLPQWHELLMRGNASSARARQAVISRRS